MPLDHDSLEILTRALKKLDVGFSQLPEFSSAAAGAERMNEVLVTLAEKLRDNYPYFHPLYAGQMLKPPHPVARLAYSLACTSIRTITRWMEDARRRNWRRKRLRKLPRCLDGRNFWGICAAAERWRIWKRCGLRGRSIQ